MSMYSYIIPGKEGKEKYTLILQEREYVTDVFDEDNIYKPMQELYCSDDGKLTNVKPKEGSIIVGFVNHVYPECLTFYLRER